MIALLLKLKGDRRAFRGSLARDPRSSSFVIVRPNPKKKEQSLEDGKLVTVEVAALYLITANYYGPLDTAQSHYLTDLSQPEVARREADTRVLIERAWKSTAEWYQRLNDSGLAKLRAADAPPSRPRT